MKFLLLSLLAVLSVSCAKDDEPIPIDKVGTMTPPKLVGRIATVPSDRKFVLIQSYGNWHVPSGTVLTTRGTNDRTANLLVTGEVMGQYAAADLQSGEVSSGDAVYFRDLSGYSLPPESTPNSPPT
ncbi:MAG TPA: hypothetical protein VM511_03625 [Luteolibacter sp.]|nr:hypothetical protein [Luteolibacter sp.]